MKRILVPLLLVLALLLSACAKTPAETDTKTDTEPTPSVEPTPEPTPEPEPEPEPTPVIDPNEYTIDREDGKNQITFYWTKPGVDYSKADMWIWYGGADGHGYPFHECAYGGKVVLNGLAMSEVVSQRAAEVAASVDGVVSVLNQLKIMTHPLPRRVV